MIVIPWPYPRQGEAYGSGVRNVLRRRRPETYSGGECVGPERVGDARIVCIGEASHGTHEFYAWRATLTRRLVEEKGFDLVGVEGDWPDCYRVNCSATGSRSASADPKQALEGFERWPTWMWANEEVVDLTRWLRKLNMGRSPDRRVGFYGLDVYSLWESIRAVLDHLEQHHPQHLDAALEACRCLEPYAEDPQSYARSTRVVPTGCEVEVVGMLGDLLQRHAATPTGTTPTPPSRPSRTHGQRSVPRPTTGPWSQAVPSRGTSATPTWPTRSTSCWTTTRAGGPVRRPRPQHRDAKPCKGTWPTMQMSADRWLCAIDVARP